MVWMKERWGRIKLTWLHCCGAYSDKRISTASNDFETTSRRVLAVDGGRSVITAAASIEMCALNWRETCCTYYTSFQGCGSSICWDLSRFQSLKVLNPMLETATSVRKWFVILWEQILWISVLKFQSKKSFSVKLTAEEVIQDCETNFGFTTNRCTNRRNALQEDKVWCYHHKNQEREYRKYCAHGDRLEIRDWWYNLGFLQGRYKFAILDSILYAVVASYLPSYSLQFTITFHQDS